MKREKKTRQKKSLGFDVSRTLKSRKERRENRGRTGLLSLMRREKKKREQRQSGLDVSHTLKTSKGKEEEEGTDAAGS